MIFYDKHYKRIYDNQKVILDGKNNIVPKCNDIVECKTYYDYDNQQLVLTDKESNEYSFTSDKDTMTLFSVEVIEIKEDEYEGSLL